MQVSLSFPKGHLLVRDMSGSPRFLTLLGLVLLLFLLLLLLPSKSWGLRWMLLQLLHQVLLNGDRDPRKKCGVPLQLHHPLTQHLSHGHLVAPTCLHINLLLIIQIRLVPVPHLLRVNAIPDIHKS